MLDLLGKAGLAEELARRFAHELNGGQCQRVAIPRAMILHPKLLVCDEAVMALDASIQTQIISSSWALSRKRNVLALVFISHNLAVVRALCDRVLVLYLGRMMELAPAQLAAARPCPYTGALFAAIPIADPDLQPARLTRVISGEPPSAWTPPSSCVFHTRCPRDCAVPPANSSLGSDR